MGFRLINDTPACRGLFEDMRMCISFLINEPAPRASTTYYTTLRPTESSRGTP